MIESICKYTVNILTNNLKKLHNLHYKVNKYGYVYGKIQLGMYGLKQATILSYNLIKKSLKDSNSLWKHKRHRTIFALTVDDFGIKYFCKEDAEHWFNKIKKHYEILVDWNGTNYCGLKFNWNYDEGYVNVSMPGYVSCALACFNHTKPIRF